MKSPKRPENKHNAYHAHVYFDADTLAFASSLREQISNEFPLKVGKLHQKPVGPHTMWSYQVLFKDTDFDGFVPWLERNRGELSVLIHADTGDDLADHTDHAYWFGDVVPLDLRGF